ncbi:activating transcription factor 7-interacting protein 1 isoform X3 [Erpetoichthys calabaricus]|uniref:activating transcription factor 7-interacting protein 1 isoform X3 n=1 Tax=Erpetoichthys calabaricus TaxID=27687 RepID=UPI00109F28A5|nr:activating transcription factor 7-interacting protein 1 isoform X3 [Erpetoichthys calabaricus]
METVEEPQKKIFKARKTMRTSDRQQLEVVHKAKEEFLQKQGQGVVEESATTGAPSPVPTPPPTPSTPLVNGKHNSNENGDLEQPDSPTVADKATSSPKSLSEDIQESEKMEELEPTSSVNINQKETVESELYEDISEPSPYSESPQDARVSQSLPAKVVQEQPEEVKTTENVREVEDTNSTTIKTIEDKGNAGKLADDGSPAENKEPSLESKVPEIKSVSPTPAPSPIVLLMPLEVEHRDKSPTQLEDIGDLAISSSVEGNSEDFSDSLVKNKQNERNVDSETEEKASSDERLEAGSPGPSVSTTAMETETGDSEEIIPILEKLAPSSSAPLSPSSPPSEDVLSPAQSPSRQDSSDLVPREGFLVLSDEDEGEKDRMDCEEVQKDTVQSTATLPEETDSTNVAEVETVEEPKTSSNLELVAEPETEDLEMSTQRKRSCSDDVEVLSEPKRRRFLEGNYEAELELKITAARADVHQKLEKIVQRILEEKIRALQWSVFDKTLEELKSRVEKIDCSKRHEAVLTGLQAKISRLSKKFGAANQAQDEARKQQEISASQADLSSGAATTTYRNVHTVRKMLETKRNDTPAQQPATVISANQGGSQTTNVQIKAVAPSTVAVTGAASIVGTSQPIVATAGTASNGGVSTTVTQSGGQAIPLQSMPVIFHVPVAVTSQPQIVQAPQGTIMTTQAQGMELVPVSSSATSGSLPGGSTANKSMLSTPPRVMQTVPASSNSTVSSPGGQTVSQVSITRTPLSTSVTYGTTTTTRTLVQPKSQASTAPASQSSSETTAVGVASKTDNQTAIRSAESSSGKSTAQGTRVVGNGPVIDLTEDDDDVQVTGVKRAPVQVTQPAQSNVHTPSARPVQSTQLPNPSPSTPTVATTPTTAPAVTTPPTPVLQTTTMHVLPTTQTTVNVMQRTTPQQAVAVTTRTPTQSQVQRTPVSSQVVYTTAPGSSRVAASQQTSTVARQGSPQTSANATRSNTQMTTYTANGPQLTIHHRAGQETSRPVHPAPLPEAPVPPRLPPEAASTSAPQKPQLKLARVQSQNGIVLSWCVAEVDRTCAAVDSYHLYAYHEDPNASSASQWKKIGEVKALPLPMACTLTQFVSGSKYYFAVRAKDIYGRFGPFCDPQSTDVIATQNS